MGTTNSPLPKPSAMPEEIHFGPGVEEALKLYAREITTYLRDLPRLLAEGQAGNHALVKGDEVLGIWSTHEMAIQAGRARFGLEPIFVKTIDPRDLQRFAILETAKVARCRP